MVIVVDRKTGEVISREGELDLDLVARQLVSGFMAWLEAMADRTETETAVSGTLGDAEATGRTV